VHSTKLPTAFVCRVPDVSAVFPPENVAPPVWRQYPWTRLLSAKQKSVGGLIKLRCSRSWTHHFECIGNDSLNTFLRLTGRRRVLPGHWRHSVGRISNFIWSSALIQPSSANTQGNPILYGPKASNIRSSTCALRGAVEIGCHGRSSSVIASLHPFARSSTL
jgi:hypothetical protein